jgi:RNA polymerase sigma factor (sigma-70 family)
MKTDFNDLCSFFEKDLGWPLGEYPFEELTFSYEAQELGIREAKAAQISSIRQLRSMAASPAWNIFFVEFETKKLLVENMREVLSSLVAVKRASTAAAQRAIFAQGSLLFIVRFGTRKEPSAAFVRFQDIPNRQTPAIQIIKWSHSDPPPRLERVRKILSDHFEWPEKPSDGKAWLTHWAEGFEQTIETQEVIEKIEQYEVARLLKAPLSQDPLPRRTMDALFKQIEICDENIKRLLFQTRENACFFIEIANLLRRGKERFDRIIDTSNLKSRERHLKLLETSESRLRELLTTYDALFDKEPHRDSFIQHIEDLTALCSKMAFNKATIRESIDRFMTETVAEDLAGVRWHTGHERARLIREISGWTKQSDKLKNVIISSCANQLKDIVSNMDDVSIEREDMMQYALIGLSEAVERYDWRRMELIGFAYWWIRNAIENGVETSGARVLVPKEIRESIAKLQRVIDMLQKEMGEKPTVAVIAKELDLPEHRIRGVLRYMNFGEYEYYGNVLDIYKQSGDLNDSTVMTPFGQDLRYRLEDILNYLTDHERGVLILRFGIKDGYSHTLDEVAQRFQITRERVRQIEAKALRKLRHPTRIRKLEGYLELP